MGDEGQGWDNLRPSALARAWGRGRAPGRRCVALSGRSALWAPLVVRLLSRQECPSSSSVSSGRQASALLCRVTGLGWPEPQIWAPLPQLMFPPVGLASQGADWRLR